MAYTVTIYDSLAEAETAIELIPIGTPIRMTSFKEGALQKVMIAKGTPPSSATPTKKAIGSTSTSVLAANVNRNFAMFVNDSNETIYVALSGTAVMNEGIPLNANGGSLEINSTNLYTGAVSAICASGSKNLAVTYG